MFEIPHETLKAHIAELTFNELRPPREAVAALLSIAPKPESIITSAEAKEFGFKGPITWTLLARFAGGVAVVVAKVEKYVDWRASGTVDVDLMTAWLPVSAITAIQLVDFEMKPFQEGEGGDLFAWTSWVIHANGLPDPIKVPAYQSNDKSDAARAAWFAKLQKDRAAT